MRTWGEVRGFPNWGMRKREVRGGVWQCHVTSPPW